MRSNDELWAEFQAAQDYKDGEMHSANPYQPGTPAHKAYNQKMDKLLKEEDRRTHFENRMYAQNLSN